MGRIRVATLAAGVVSVLALGWALTPIAVPAALFALAVKLSALRAAGAGALDRARDRLGLAVGLELVAAATWGPALLDSGAARATLPAALGTLGTIGAFVGSSLLAAEARRRWGLERRLAAEPGRSEGPDGRHVGPPDWSGPSR